jgi:hypothetical protein
MKNILILTSVILLSVSCKKEGCTDYTATNFNSAAQKDDGSCTYTCPPTTAEKLQNKLWILDSVIKTDNGNVFQNTNYTANPLYMHYNGDYKTIHNYPSTDSTSLYERSYTMHLNVLVFPIEGYTQKVIEIDKNYLYYTTKYPYNDTYLAHTYCHKP